MIGEIPGYPEGSEFADRRILHDLGVHKNLQKGIGVEGASIVLSGGYVDDSDEGDEVIYTGEGGRDPNTGRQIKDQTLTVGNLNLAKRCDAGDPVRVIRGYKAKSRYAPAEGYRYDGLYRIDEYWHEQGQDGFLIWRYHLSKIGDSDVLQVNNAAAAEDATLHAPEGVESPERAIVISTRVIRSSKVTNYVKELYSGKCQISGIVLETPSGPYSEGCHIKPLGKPHNGPDLASNVLCLCPNMHVLFDKGAIALADDLTLLGMDGGLEVHPEHKIDVEYIRYHREHFFKPDL